MMATDLRVIDGGRAEESKEPTKVPPADLESEALIVGTLLLGRKESLSTFREVLKGEHFFSSEHRHVYEAALSVATQYGDEAVDMATIVARLTELGLYGKTISRESLDELRGNVGVTGSHRHREWSISVHDHWRRRRLISIWERAEGLAYLGVENTQAFVEEAARKMLWLANAGHGRAEETTKAMLTRLFREIEQRRAAREAGNVVDGMGAPIGLATFDRVLRGMRLQKKYTIVARPGRGKSAMAMQWCGNAAASGFGAVYYGAEPRMSRDDHVLRLIASLAHIDCKRIESGHLDPREQARLVNTVAQISEWPLEIVDARGWPVSKIRNDARRRAGIFRTVHKRPLAVVAVDHIGVVRPEDGASFERRAFVGHTTNELASMAGELNVCVLELAQEARGDKGAKKKAAPTLEDISDSSEIEKSTEVVVFLRRIGERDDFGIDKTRAHIIKNSGDLIDFELEFISGELRFCEWRQAAWPLFDDHE
jgi:replicative DNA helicase